MAAFAAAAVAAAPAARAGNCSFQTVTSVIFGSYDVFSASALDSTATISYKCSPPVATPTIYLSQGGSGTYSPRQMVGPSGTLASYNLYLDASHTTVWGDGSGGSAFITGPDPQTGNQIFTYTIFGRVPAGQDLVGGGAYTDSLTITINF
jgi:spore coat protein U domain-containing protein, fimbrial subunit CupE1/2/3/6